MAGTLGAEGQSKTTIGLSRADREQAHATLLRCFAESLGADCAALVGRLGGPAGDGGSSHSHSLVELLSKLGDGDGARVVSTWSRDGQPVGLSWVRGSPLARALDEDRTIVEVGSAAPLRIGYGESLHEGVATPVRMGPARVGALYAGFPQGTNHRDPHELRWITEAFAAVAALCLSEEAALAATLRASRYDGLTGCLSSSALLDALDAEIARSTRHHHSLSCCFVDLDGFKAVNDERGHLEGNRVLVAVASALLSGARRYDLIGRFGGDEFVAVLPQTNLRGARHVAERMGRSIAGAVAESTQLEVTASIGVAQWTEGMSRKELIEEADRALREARRAGLAPRDGNGHTRLGSLTRRLLGHSGTNAGGESRAVPANGRHTGSP